MRCFLPLFFFVIYISQSEYIKQRNKTKKFCVCVCVCEWNKNNSFKDLICFFFWQKIFYLRKNNRKILKNNNLRKKRSFLLICLCVCVCLSVYSRCWNIASFDLTYLFLMKFFLPIFFCCAFVFICIQIYKHILFC